MFGAVESATNYTEMYQYDPLGEVDTYGYSQDKVWGANVFTARADQSIVALGFYAPVPASGYTLYAGSSLDTLRALGSGTLAIPGFHTVKLASMLNVTAGDPFAVAIRLVAPGAEFPLSVEYQLPGYSTQATAAPGQSFTRMDDGPWRDLTDWNGSANVCLKAYAGSADVGLAADVTPPQTIASGADAGWHARPVTVTLAAADPDPAASGVAYTEYRLDGGSWTHGSSVTILAPRDTKVTHIIGFRSVDLAGNIEVEQTCKVKIATTVAPSPLAPPTTSASGSDDAWHRSPVTVTFSALPSVGGLAVAYTEYRLDGGEWTRGTRVFVPASADHSADGEHVILYRSADIGVPANIEEAKSCAVKIDTTGPSISTKNARGSVGHAIALRLCVDDVLSPQATAITVVVRNARGTVVMRWAASGTRATGGWMSRGWTPRAKGTYRYYVSARDLAGNAQSKMGSARVVVR